MTISKRKKIAKRILDSLNKAELSDNKGEIIYVKMKLNKKDRKHSGRVTPKLGKVNMKYSEIIKNCLEPQIFWDDWTDYRDGFRNKKI